MTYGANGALGVDARLLKQGFTCFDHQLLHNLQIVSFWRNTLWKFCIIVLVVVLLWACTENSENHDDDVQRFFDVPSDTLVQMQRYIDSCTESRISMFAFCVDTTYFAGNVALYRLINDIVVKHLYTGEYPLVYDWLWHTAAKTDIEKYLRETKNVEAPFDSISYANVLEEIKDSLMIFYEEPFPMFEVARKAEIVLRRWNIADAYKTKLLKVTSQEQRDSLIRAWAEDEEQLRIVSARIE